MKGFLRLAIAALFCVTLLLGLSACKKEEDPDAKPTVYEYLVGDPFTTNVKSSGISGTSTKKLMLKCSVTFQVTDKKVAETAAETNYIVRNAVTKVLVQLTEDEVIGNTDLDAIEQRLTEAANEAMETDVFYAAKITEFAAA